MKVIRAFNILTGSVDKGKEKAYCPALFEGLECCSSKMGTTDTVKQIHVRHDKNFVANLISKGNLINMGS